MKPLGNLLITFAGLARYLEYGNVLVQSSDAFHEIFFIEVQIRDEVDLVEQDDVGLFECKRVLVRLDVYKRQL